MLDNGSAKALLPLGCSRGVEQLSDGSLSDRPPATRSAVTNGAKLLSGLDGRTLAARRYKDIAFSLADDLGGAAELTEAQRCLIRQAAALTVHSEQLQAAMLRGEAVDAKDIVAASNASGRILAKLGLRRSAVASKAPSIADYLKARKVAAA